MRQCNRARKQKALAHAQWRDAMTTAAVPRHSAKCPCCEIKLISPEWSETLAENETINFWRCPICGNNFETTDTVVEPEPSESELAEEFLSELLVA
jgi:hypothetical protein